MAQRTNYIPNPSAEVNTTTWIAYAPAGFTVALARDTTHTAYGIASLRIDVTANSAANGALCGARNGSRAIPLGTIFTIAASLRSSNVNLIPYLYVEASNAEAVYIGSRSETPAAPPVDIWERHVMTNNGAVPLNPFATAAATAQVYLMVKSVTTGSTGSVWADEIILESGVTDGSYFDGDSPNATWTGTPHASTSVLTLPDVDRKSERRRKKQFLAAIIGSGSM